MSLTFEEQIARIEADPLLTALSRICDLGTCGGRGGFQKALDIASAAVEAGLHAPDTSRETSAEVASIAGELLNLTADDLDNVAWHAPGFPVQLLAKIHKVAASALGQRQ